MLKAFAFINQIQKFLFPYYDPIKTGMKDLTNLPILQHSDKLKGFLSKNAVFKKVLNRLLKTDKRIFQFKSITPFCTPDKQLTSPVTFKQSVSIGS